MPWLTAANPAARWFQATARRLHSAAAAAGLLLLTAFLLTLAGLLIFGWLAVLVHTHRADPLDVRIVLAAQAARQPIPTLVMRAATLIGSGTVAIPAALGLMGWLLLRRRRRAALLYFGACLSGWALNGAAKAIFRRSRPDMVTHIGPAGWYSFPSGHAMLAPLVFGLGTLLLLRRSSPARRVAGLVLVSLLIVTIAVSRVYLGAHYPSDVLAALAAGTGWGALWVFIAEGMSRLNGRRSDATAD